MCRLCGGSSCSAGSSLRSRSHPRPSPHRTSPGSAVVRRSSAGGSSRSPSVSSLRRPHRRLGLLRRRRSARLVGPLAALTFVPLLVFASNPGFAARVAPAPRALRTGGRLQPRLRRAAPARRPGTALRPRHGDQHCGADLAPGTGLRRRRRARRGRAAAHRDCDRRRRRPRRRRAPAAASSGPRSTPPHSR